MKVARGDLRNCGICGERGRRVSLRRRRASANASTLGCNCASLSDAATAARGFAAAGAAADFAAVGPRSFLVELLMKLTRPQLNREVCLVELLHVLLLLVLVLLVLVVLLHHRL